MTRPEARKDSLDSLRRELAELEASDLRRHLRAIDGPQRPVVVVDGRPCANFSSNNYLGLADHPSLRQAARDSLEVDGFGAGSARLIAGNLAPHRRLEVSIAAWKRTEAALLFNSGYHANLGLLTALAGPDDAIFSDERNHASIIDGARLSRAQVVVYPHNDVAELARLLRGTGRARRRLVVTETIFSMDGDPAPLPELCQASRAAGAMLIVDEAHASGVLGVEGIGLSQGLPVDVQMGTLGKALGSFGAYVAARSEVVELLVNRARSFIFTTALPPAVSAASLAAIDLVRGVEGDRLRRKLAENVEALHRGLGRLGLAPPSPSHIVPIPVGNPARAMAVSERLLERGLFAQGIRPPSVPAGGSRLRLSVMATHEPAQIAAMVAALGEALAEVGA